MSEKFSATLSATGFAALLLLSTMLLHAAPSTSAVPGDSQPTGVIVPLYTPPNDSSWAAIIHARAAYPEVPIIAIVNPHSGPGAAPSQAYAAGILELKNAGVTVLGYVATGYGSASLSSVESQVQSYASWYHVDGIMFDEMPTVGGYESYYQTLDSFVTSLGMNLTVGNPGQTTSASYIGTLDKLIVYEGLGFANSSSISSAYPGSDRNNFAAISYGVHLQPRSDARLMKGLSGSVGYVYITNGVFPNPYDSFPNYFLSEVSMLNATLGTSTQPSEPVS